MQKDQNIQVVMVAHGSPNAAAVAATKAYNQQFAQDCDYPVSLCFLEFETPDMQQGLAQAAAAVGAGGKVVILPLFLGAAGHMKNDLPVGIDWARDQYPDVAFVCAAVFSPHANLAVLLDTRINEALDASGSAIPAEDSHVLLAGRGSSDPDSNSEIARAARLLFESGHYQRVDVAFQAVAKPSIVEGIEQAVRLGARQIIVSMDLLFTGWVEGKITEVAKEKAAQYDLPIVFSKPLGVHPLMLEISTQRMNEALRGKVSMNCDVCRYRFELPGHAEHVGQAPQGHHHEDEEHTH